MIWILHKILMQGASRGWFALPNSEQGISSIAKNAISIFIKFEIAIVISIAIWKKIADRDRSFAIADLLGDLFT